MALVSGGFEGSITVADNGDNRSTLSYQFDPATTPDFATALSGMAGLVTDLETIIEGEIVGYRVNQIFFEDSIALPPSNVENENKASVTYRIDGTNKKGTLKIPTPVPGIFVGPSGASANQVDVTDLDLQAYADNFRTAGQFLISDGEKLDQLLVGKRISAKNNNG